MLRDWWRRLMDGLRAPPIEFALAIDDDGWLSGPGVVRLPAHSSWYYDRLTTSTGLAAGVVHHYSATDHGTALTMAKRRMRPRKPDDRAASWHLSIEGDGTIVQMVPLICGAWHCSKGAIDGVRINRATIGLEWIGHGDRFPAAQVESGGDVMEAIAARYPITRARAGLGHSQFDPARRRDPGDRFMKTVLPLLLERAYGPMVAG